MQRLNHTKLVQQNKHKETINSWSFFLRSKKKEYRGEKRKKVWFFLLFLEVLSILKEQKPLNFNITRDDRRTKL